MQFSKLHGHGKACSEELFRNQEILRKDPPGMRRFVHSAADGLLVQWQQFQIRSTTWQWRQAPLFVNIEPSHSAPVGRGQQRSRGLTMDDDSAGGGELDVLRPTGQVDLKHMIPFIHITAQGAIAAISGAYRFAHCTANCHRLSRQARNSHLTTFCSAILSGPSHHL